MRNKDSYWNTAPFSGTYKEWDKLDQGQKNYFINSFWDFQNLSKFSCNYFYNFKYLIDSKGFSIARKQKRDIDYPTATTITLTKI